MLKVVYFCGFEGFFWFRFFVLFCFVGCLGVFWFCFVVGFFFFLNLHNIIIWGNLANSAKAFSMFFIDPNHIATWLGYSVVGLH